MRFRRTLAAVAAFTVAGLVAPPAADAATFQFHGVVVDAGGAPVAGIGVIATEPGAITPAWATTTGADGTWSAEADAEEYDLYFDGGNDYQSGYRGCSGYLYPDPGSACTAGPGILLETYIVASFATGRVLDSATTDPVAGALVSVYREDGTTLIGSSETAADGTYRVDGIDGEEIGLHVDGSSVGYAGGWFACAAGVVVPTFGEACTHLPGDDGDRYLDAIVGEPSFRLRSRADTAITLIVRDPGTVGAVLGYELSCRSRETGDTTVIAFVSSGDTEDGFDSGLNRCRLRVLTPYGTSPESGTRAVRVR